MNIQENLITPALVEGTTIYFYPSQKNSVDFNKHSTGQFSHSSFLNNIAQHLPSQSSVLDLSSDPCNSVLFFDRISGSTDIFAISLLEENVPSLERVIQINAITSVKLIIPYTPSKPKNKKSLFSLFSREEINDRQGDMLFAKTKIDCIYLRRNHDIVELLKNLSESIRANRPIIATSIKAENGEAVQKYLNANDYEVNYTEQSDNYHHIIFCSKQPAPCSGNLFIDQNNRTTCYENLPTTIEEMAIIKWLKEDKSILQNSTALHVGTGNGHLLQSLDLCVHVDSITISGAEKEKVEQLNLDNVEVQLINKHNIIELKRLKKHYDIIIDVNLKSFTCCEKHYDTYMDYIMSKLSDKGIIITADSGVNFGWNGNTKRAYTPGSKKVDAATNFRILGNDGLEKLASKYSLSIEKHEIQDIEHHHSLLNTDGPPLKGNETIIILRRSNSPSV